MIFLLYPLPQDMRSYPTHFTDEETHTEGWHGFQNRKGWLKVSVVEQYLLQDVRPSLQIPRQELLPLTKFFLCRLDQGSGVTASGDKQVQVVPPH